MKFNKLNTKIIFRIFVLNITVLAVIGFTEIALSADWPQWRGLGRNDVTSESSGWPESWPPEKIWNRNVERGCTSPIIVDGKLYVMGWHGKGNLSKNPVGEDTIYCLDARTGKELWRQTYKCRYQSRIRKGDIHRYGGPSSTPTFDLKTKYLYTLSIDGDFRCWDTKQEGELVWSVNFFDQYNIPQRANVGKGRRDYGFTSAPLIQNNLVVVEVGAKEGILLAFDKKTGKQQWMSSCTEPAGHTSGPVSLTVEGINCIADLTIRKLVVMRIDSGYQGETIAEYPWQTDFANNIPTPAVSGNQIIVTSDYNVSRTSRLEVSLEGISEKWHTRRHSKVSSLVIYKGNVYMADGPLKCLDLETGKLKWRGGNFWHGSCLVTADDKVIAFGKGNLVLVEALPSDSKYRELSKVEDVVPDVCYPHVVLSDGIICCKDKVGNIVCFSLSR